MTRYTSILLLCFFATMAWAEGADDGLADPGAAARAARVIASAYANRTVQDYTQVYRGAPRSGQGGGVALGMNIGNVYSDGYGQPPRENNVYVGEAIQICLRCR